VKGKKIPYLPGAENNNATVYARMKESSYPDREAYLRARIELLEVLIREATVLDQNLALRYSEDMIKYVRKIKKMGINDYDGDLATELMRTSINTADDDELLRKAVKEVMELAPGASNEQIMELTGSVHIVSMFTDMFEEEADVLLEMLQDRLDDFVVGDENDLDVAFAMFMTIKMVSEEHRFASDIITEIADELPEDFEDRDENRMMIYSEAVDNIDDPEWVERIMDFAETMRGRCTLYEYAAVGLVYADNFLGDETRKERVTSILNAIIDDGESDLEGDGSEVSLSCMAKACLLLYNIDPEKGSMMKAVEYAEQAVDEGETDAIDTLNECLSHDVLSKREKARIKRVIERAERKVDRLLS